MGTPNGGSGEDCTVFFRGGPHSAAGTTILRASGALLREELDNLQKQQDNHDQ